MAFAEKAENADN